MSKWISVADELPQLGQPVLVSYSTNYMPDLDIRWRDEVDLGGLPCIAWRPFAQLDREYPPTHWMAIPEPPRQQ